MTAEEAIIDLKDKKPPTKDELRRSRTIAIVLALSAVITILAFVFALVQQLEAKKQAAIANQVMQRSMELQQEQKIAIEEANRQLSIAESERLKAIKTLEDCKLSQKKK